VGGGGWGRQQEAIDYSELKVAELREICEKRGIDLKGKKGVLVERLEAADEEEALEADEGGEEEEVTIGKGADYVDSEEEHAPGPRGGGVWHGMVAHKGSHYYNDDDDDDSEEVVSLGNDSEDDEEGLEGTVTGSKRRRKA
jgi:hypothetical protein